MSGFKSINCSQIILLIWIVMGISSCSVKQITSRPAPSLIDSFKVITDLDLEITETSGLERFNNRLITHNDSGDQPSIYFLNTEGLIEDRITYKHLKNVDWEDIAIGNKHLFIADIGNNYGDRKDLVLYKIPITELNNPDVTPGTIELSYTSQKIFERRNQRHSYDGEALVYVNDKLLLFSKDWVNFTTDVYFIKDTIGSQSLVRKQQIDIDGLVTGATFNGKNRIVLCGYNSVLEPFVAVLSYQDSKLELIERIRLPVDNGAQIEAITFFERSAQQEIYFLSSEAVNIKLGEDEAMSAGQLYKMTLKIQ